MESKYIIFGATGVIGTELQELLREANTLAVVRRKGSAIDGVREIVHTDLLDISPLSTELEDANVLIALGTTKAKTPDKEKYYQIDHDMPVHIAAQAKDSGARTVHVISAMGADPESRIFYNATKGKMERDVKEVFPEAYFYRPSLIMGDRDEMRIGESIAKGFFSLINTILPRKYRGIYPRKIARTIIDNCRQVPNKKIWENDDMLNKF
ncbi:NAD(P)H-binding protein [Phaeocystidibacter luteus]|uniref:NAD(P)H-binding protein n=1 Tax=Phaeocystidibacter luteus TaxID=911197 RepID=UPI0014790BE5|nr:NAD(P)H-binding protein [Phaeocystidibacter luteus]